MQKNHPTQSALSQILFRLALYIPFVVVCSVIYRLSSMSHPPIPIFMKFSNGDKILHMAAFFIVGFTAVLPLAFTKRFLGFSLALRALALAAMYAAADEIHQAYVPMRQSSYLDFVADIVGAILGIFVFWLLVTTKIRRR